MEAKRLEDQISQLKYQLKLKHQDLAAMYNISAPIRRLPFELLSNIFYEYCFLKETKPIVSRKSSKPQLLISQICFTWRKVAFGTPRLWSELGISLGRRSGISVHDTMMVHSWLRRSGALFLNVSIVQHHRNSQLFSEILPNQLLPFCNRLGSLSLALPLECLSSFFSKHFELPVLKKLDLSFLHAVNKPDSNDSRTMPLQCRSRFTTFLNSRQLWAVKLNLPRSAYKDNDKFILTRIIFMLPLPLSQLRSLHLELHHQGDYSLSDACSYLNVLRNCQSTLVKCRLVRCPTQLRDALVDSPDFMAFLTLKILCLEQWEEENEARFIQHITVPSLVTLRIDHSVYGGDDFSEFFSNHLIDLKIRSSFSLSTLELIRVRMMCTEDVLSVLAAFPTIEHLKFCDCNYNTKVLMRGLQLCDSKAQDPITPKLVSLYLVDFEVIPKGSEKFIVDMVESRTSLALNGVTRSCLTTFTLAYEQHQLSDSMIARLNELLDLDLETTKDWGNLEIY
ncbi:hypothetical protein DFJ43DRAFT_1163500 [Lentinula guzmanii]|uniref:F-box domain-containing protein n=1 Tax=Lentinula guzmanii TaxID=2804957 RepID=A0AA38N550_9AGAR|nr:hypothetical protein DFJ43DRAFT_1163500 [Lentinula guzmanii]